PGVVGMAYALKLAHARMSEDAQREARLRDRLWQGIQEQVEAVYLNGATCPRLASNLNVRVAGVEGEAMLLMLDMYGICASSGSACTSGSLDPSHVLLALGIPPEEAHGSLRLTLGRSNTPEDIDYFLSVFPQVVARLREMSPVWCERCRKERTAAHTRTQEQVAGQRDQ
ncbi:MAG: aminotransferase class V-fold PLP-dependent enzyme, partial [Thermoleophilia bacterium]|nr:aminotransferase class V-fold PLP-dependent enzyme [Thermoleophilia bacterium]